MIHSTRTSPNRWVARIHSAADANFLLVCFPFAGGGTTLYRAWTAKLPRSIEICPIQLPGRECRITEPPERNMTSLVRDLVRGIRPLLDIPFGFFGHSLGAIVAFEVARELRRSGGPHPAHLFLSAHGPASVGSRPNPFHLLPDAEFICKLRQFGGIPDAVLQNRELLDIVLPVLRADFELYETHRHTSEEPLAIPFTVLGGAADRSVPANHLVAWRSETASQFNVHMFPGGHFYLQEPANAVTALIAHELQHGGVNHRELNHASRHAHAHSLALA